MGHAVATAGDAYAPAVPAVHLMQGMGLVTPARPASSEISQAWKEAAVEPLRAAADHAAAVDMTCYSWKAGGSWKGRIGR